MTTATGSHTPVKNAVRRIRRRFGRAKNRLNAMLAGNAPGSTKEARVSDPSQPRASLTDLAIQHSTDKWGTHRYTPHYEASLKHLRKKTFTLFEIGIGVDRGTRREGASLRMWRDFFPKATIVGLDILDKRHLADDRIVIYQGSQTDQDLLRRIMGDHPDIRVIVDDGSHRPAHVRATFEVLFPLLASGGIYCMEDLQTSYWPAWGGATDPRAEGTSMDLVKQLIDGLNYEEFVIDGYQPSYTDLHVTGVSAWHNMAVIYKGDNREGTNRDRIAHLNQK